MWNPFARQKPTPPPAVPTDKIFPLHYFDDHAIYRAVVLRFMLRFDDVLAVENLKQSLEKLLRTGEGWDILGARLRLNDNGKLEYHVPATYNEDRPAVQYSHVKYDMGIEEHDVASKLPKASSRPSVGADTDDFMPLTDAVGFPTKLDDYLYADIPQLALHTVSFNDATLVTLSWPHTSFDALGQQALFDAWTLVLAGREDEVPSLRGVDSDPLGEFGKHVSVDTYKLRSRVLSSWQMMIFAARYIFDLVWYKQEQSRMICMPAATLKALRERAMQELADEKAEHTFVTEGDVLCAWWSRHAAPHLNHDSEQTVSVSNAFNLRKDCMNDLLPPSPRVYVSNAVFSVVAFFSAREIFHLPLSQIAMRIRQSVAELGTREQLEAHAAVHRQVREATGYPPVLGDATMQMINITNWTRGKFFEIDFSAAVVREGPNFATRSNKIGRPSFVLPYGLATGLSARNAIAIIGKDVTGTYWLSGVLRKDLWARVEKDVAAAVY